MCCRYGFYGFNTGSTQGVTGGKIYLASMIAVTTTITATAACATVLFLLKWRTGRYGIIHAGHHYPFID